MEDTTTIELKLKKHLKKKLRQSAYKKTVDWQGHKTPHIIFTLIGFIPFIVAAIVVLIEYFTKQTHRELIPMEALGAGLSAALPCWAVPIIYFKTAIYNAAIPYERYTSEQLMYDDQMFYFRESELVSDAESYVYEVPYSQIEQLIDNPNIQAIQIVGHFEMQRVTKSGECSVYNQDHQSEDTIMIGCYYEKMDDFRQMLISRTGLSFQVKDF